MKIGVSSYSFSQYLSDGRLNIHSVIKKAADMGFDAIEFTDLPKDEGDRSDLARLLKKEAAENNIELSAYVVGGNLLCDDQAAEVERLKGEIDIANILGVKIFRYDVLYRLPQNMNFYSALDKVAPAMHELAEYAQKYGIKTSIENHGHAFQDADRVEKVYYAVNHENFGLLLDIGNFMCADEDPYKSVSRLANLAVHVHLKDFIKQDFYSTESKENYFRTRGRNYLLGVAVGDGDAKSAQSIDILQSFGYDGYLDIEFEGPKDCIKELEKGLAFARSIIG